MENDALLDKLERIARLLEKNNSLLQAMLHIMNMEHTTIDMMDGNEVPPNVVKTWENKI